MNKTVFSIMIISLLLLSGLLINPVSSAEINTNSTGATFYVDDIPGEGPDNPAENFTSIQDAINACFDGDTVFVYNGEYNENIVINKSINLTGEDNEKTIIISSNIDITSDEVSISSFKLETSSSGKVKFRSCNSLLTNCNIINLDIYMSSPSCYIEVIENNIQGGLSLSTVDNNKILRNDISGIVLSRSNNNEINNNKINGGGIGLLEECKNNDIFNNEIRNSEFGIVSDSKNNRFFYNDFISNDVNAFITYAGRSTWRHNYWERPRALPKPIFGFENTEYGLRIRLDFDWFPAKTPNCS